MEKTSSVRFAKLLTLSGSDSIKSFLTLERSAEIHRGYYRGDEFSFLENNFETEGVSDVIATPA